MKVKLIGVFRAFFLCLIARASMAQAPLDKPAFYAALAANDTGKINTEIKLVNASAIHEKNAFIGALLMKKAALVRGVSAKLNLFKSGHKKLEAAIAKNSSDAELHFLRLMIQENAPGALGYKKDMQTDGEIIKKNYKELPSDVQQAIGDYSKKSKILNPSDF